MQIPVVLWSTQKTPSSTTLSPFLHHVVSCFARETNNLRQQNQKLFSLTLSSSTRERQYEKLLHLFSLTLSPSLFFIFLRKNLTNFAQKKLLGVRRKGEYVCTREKHIKTPKKVKVGKSGCSLPTTSRLSIFLKLY